MNEKEKKIFEDTKKWLSDEARERLEKENYESLKRHIETMPEYAKEKCLREIEEESKLTDEELRLKKAALWLSDVHENRVVIKAYNDPNKCPDPFMSNQIRNATSLMKEIASKPNLLKIKKLIKPREYSNFLSAYDEFKRTGKFTVENPNVRD